jgi:hypothetical protein
MAPLHHDHAQSTPRLRTEWIRGTQRELPRALSSPDCQTDDVAVRLEPFDVVHQTLHQEKSATILMLDVFRRGWTFVNDIEDHGIIAYGCTHTHALFMREAVTAKDRVRYGFGERDTDVERAFARRQLKLATLSRRELDYAVNVPNVAGDLDIESDVRVGHQKLSSARSRVSEIWKRVSSFVSSNRV